MPVYSFAVCTSHLFYLLWKIEESSVALRAQLPLEFLADFQSMHLSSEDRIQQSLAVRLALYYLLKKLDFPISLLSKHPQGGPVLEDSSFYISFAHTRYIAAVALSTAFPIGLDIEVVRPSLRRVQKRFLRKEEMQDGCLEKLAIYWCAKEALYKRLDKEQVATFKDICIEPFLLQSKGKLIADLNEKKYTMGYERIEAPGLDPHVLAWCAD